MYPSSSDEVEKWKRYTIVVAIGVLVIGLIVGGLVGYYAGYNLGYGYGYQSGSGFAEQIHTELDTFKENTNNLVLVFGDCSWAIDTARATAFLLDEHASIYCLMGSRVSENIKNTGQARQRYFADKTVSLLDKAYESASKIQTDNNDAIAKLELLKSKIMALKNLATEMRVIAYKDDITDEDVDRAFAIVNTMEEYNGDVYNIVRSLLDILSQEAMEK